MAITTDSFTWIQRSWTFGNAHFPFDIPFSLPTFYVWRKIGKKCIDLNFEFFAKCTIELRAFFTLYLSVQRFQMSLEGLSFFLSKTLLTFGIIYLTNPLLQNMTKIFAIIVAF